MGAKTWMLVRSSGDVREILRENPVLDRSATSALAETLFSKERLEPLDAGDLSYTCPPDDELDIGSFNGLSILAAKEFGIDYPSKLEQRFLQGPGTETVYLHAMHSVVDWFAFAVWQQGTLVRSLSLSPDSGILEDIGPRLPFELPYWAGQHPAIDPEELDEGEDPYPFPFHPLELGEAALKELFGYQLEGFMDDSLIEPEDVPLLRFRRKRSLLKFW
ncbi:MAG: hypothetical protein WC538_19730 [Thermoanaerobaculia bacterium]|jgi:hypothetical protein